MNVGISPRVIPWLIIGMLFVFHHPMNAQTYCSAGASWCDEHIGNVTVAGINNTSGCGLVNGYSDYTAISGTMTAGLSYPITVTNGGWPYSGDEVHIWIDWNNNGILNDPGEFYQTTTLNYAQFTATILCPVGTVTGPKRMRIRMDYYPMYADPCGMSSYGEVEDYTINVIGLGDPPPAITLLTSPACGMPTVNPTVTATITDNGTVTATRIWYRKNTGPWYNASHTSVVGTTYTFSINHSTMGGVAMGDVVYWYLAAMDNLNGVSTLPSGGGGTSPPGSTPPSFFNSYGIAVSLPYSQSFDSPNHGWTFGGPNSSWRVGAPLGLIGNTAASPPNALLWQNTSGVYNPNEQSWAMSPPMDFSTVKSDPVLAFSQKRNIENSWDGVWVEYTTNGGATWTTLGTFPPGPSSLNWYTIGTLISSPNQPAWSADSYTAWVRSVHTLTGLAGQPCVQIRFRASCDASVEYSGMAIDDLAVGDFPQKDIEVVSVDVGYAQNRWAQVEGLPHPVSATIRSLGWEAPPTSVTLVYKAGSVPTGTGDGVAQTFSPTWSGGVATVTFTTQYTPPAPVATTIFVRAFYAGDANPGNDSKSYVMNVQNNKVYGFENFSGLPTTGLPTNFRTGWTVINNGGPETWGVHLDGSNPVGAYVNDGNPDDYLISPPALLLAGSSYRVSFVYGGCDWGTGPNTLQLLYGKTPDPTTMNLLHTWTVPSSSVPITAEGSIPGYAPYFNTDPGSPTNYYIAFRTTNPNSFGCVAIDDIVLEDNPSPPPKIGYGLPGDPVTSFIDDPAIPIRLTAVYKQPGVINKTYEVTTTTNIFGPEGDFLWDVQTATPWITITKSTPDPTAQGYNFTPPRPRQHQTFTMTINPTGLPVGVHYGRLTFYGILFNNEFPPPANGLVATNEPYDVTVELRVSSAGTKLGPSYLEATLGPLTVGNTYPFNDPATNEAIATVSVTSGTIPQMTIRVYPNQLPLNLSRMMYVKRYWQITHTGTNWMADITFPYADQEATMVADPMQLRGIRQIATRGPWEDPIVGTTSVSDPASNSVTVSSFSPANIDGNIALAHSYLVPSKSGEPMPAVFSLDQNYPNPFNPTTTISFSVAEERPVRIVVYNSLGMEMAELVNETLAVGRYTVVFDSGELSPGAYLCRMTSGDYVRTIQMVLSR